MNCPHCNFEIRVLAITEAIGFDGAQIQNFVAPIACEYCYEISLLMNGELRKLAPEEMEAVKQSPAWKSLQRGIRALRQARMRANAMNN